MQNSAYIGHFQDTSALFDQNTSLTGTSHGDTSLGSNSNRGTSGQDMPNLYLDYKDSIQLDAETKKHLKTLDDISLDNLVDKSSSRLEFLNEIINKEMGSELISQSLRMSQSSDVMMDLSQDQLDQL